MIMRLVLPRYEKVHFLSGICSLFFCERKMRCTILEVQRFCRHRWRESREAYCIRMLDGVHAERARKELIEHNLRLVVYIAQKV